MTTKRCTKCSETKPLEMFESNKRAQCKVCRQAARRARRAANPESVRQQKRAWAAANPEKVRQYRRVQRRATYAANPEKERAAYRKKYATDPEAARQRTQAWKDANPGKVRAANKARKVTKLRATPAWADHEAIAKVYAEQQELIDHGIDCHVDHIIPLRGKTVCGLHVHNNLQLLLPADNIRKSNKLIEELL